MAKHVFTKEEVHELVEKENVHFLRVMFSDLFGTTKSVDLPVSQLDELMNNKMMFDGSSIDGFVRINESDMYLYPDMSTWLVFPWGEEHGKVARVICSVHMTDGTPFAGDPRNNLIRVLDDMKKAGFTSFNIGPEPEFFLFKTDEKGNPTTEVNDNENYFDWSLPMLVKTAVATSFWHWKRWALTLRLRTMKLLLANTKSTLNTLMLWKLPTTFKHSSLSLSQLLKSMVCTPRLCQSHCPASTALGCTPTCHCLTRTATTPSTMKRANCNCLTRPTTSWLVS